jgi:hypothetical protein
MIHVLKHLASTTSTVPQGRLDLGLAAGLEVAVRVDPQPLGVRRPDRTAQRVDDLRTRRTLGKWMFHTGQLVAEGRSADGRVRAQVRGVRDWDEPSRPGAAGGLPWYMALLGWGSLITSYPALPFVPEVCRTTLRTLASPQSDRFDDVHDAKPGRITAPMMGGGRVSAREQG